MYKSYNFIWFLGVPLCLGLVGISRNLVPWFFGKGYEKVIVLLCILSFLIFSIGISNVTGVQYLIPTKRQNIVIFSVIVGSVVNFVINLILIPRLYSIGTSIASVVAESIISIIQLFILRKELSISHIVSMSKKYIVSGAVMLALLLFESTKLNSCIINTCIMIMSGMLVYFGMLFILRDRFFLSNLKAILEKIRLKIIN